MNTFNFARSDPETAALLARFDAEVAAVAGRSHAGYLDGDGRLADASTKVLLPDGLHFNEAGHALVAAEFVRALDAGALSLKR